MAKITPDLEEISKMRVRPTEGEWKLIKYLAENLPEDFEIFFQPHINGLHPDVVILRRNFGVYIIEVKDWNLDLYEVKNQNEWYVKDKQGNTQRIKSPVDQVRNYRDDICDLYLRGFYEKLFWNNGYNKVINTGIFFSCCSQDYVENFQKKYRMDKDLKKMQYTNFFGNDKSDLLNKLKSLLSISRLFDDDLYEEIKRLLRPTMYDEDQIKFDSFNLNKKQKEILEKCRGGKHNVSGVVGSGKTFLMAHMAVDAYKKTKERVLILTYNITLVNYVRDKISQILGNSKMSQGIIDVIHYHQFIKQFIDEYDDNYYNCENFIEFLNKYVVENEKPLYKTILVDETQDFKKNWIENIHKILKSEGELVFFSDVKQTIYGNVNLENFDGHKYPQTKIKGCYQLGETQRLCMKISDMANDFQKDFLIDKYGFDEVENHQLNLDFNALRYYGYYYMNSFDADKIIKEYYDKAREFCLNDNDICFLCAKKSYLQEIEIKLRKSKQLSSITFATVEEIEKIKKQIEGKKDHSSDEKNDKKIFDYEVSKLERPKKFHFYMNSGNIKLSTIHSFKGLEAKTAILILSPPPESFDDKNNDNIFKYNELVYSAFTRARENLLVFYVENEGQKHISSEGKKYNDFFEKHLGLSKMDRAKIMPRFSVANFVKLDNFYDS